MEKLEDALWSAFEKIINLIWRYAPFIAAIFGVAGVKFFRSKMMGKKLTFWGHLYSAGLTIVTGLLSIPIIENLSEKKRYIALIIITLIAEHIINYIIANWPAFIRYLIKYKPNKEE